MAENSYDFGGWATKNDLLCSDGRTIRKNAFAEDDGKRVPLLWNHDHNDPKNVVGFADLINTPNGVYSYCSFNNTERAQIAKSLIEHGDITTLSIYANQLKQDSNKNVYGGSIKEVSLVQAGANPGAYIDQIISHGDEDECSDMAEIYTGETLELFHSDNYEEPNNFEDIEEYQDQEVQEENTENMVNENVSVDEVLDSLDEIQMSVVEELVGQAIAQTEERVREEVENEMAEEMAQSALQGDEYLMHNIFDQDIPETTLTHADLAELVDEAKRSSGSLRETFLQHGIDNIDFLFPDNKNITNEPMFINTIPQDWIGVVMNGVKAIGFSRIKMMCADITADDARALGYIKGNYKVEEQFELLKRTFSPQTIYKKQKLDRDDVVDITDFDVIAWLKKEMRMKLDEELARAYLFGDGRSNVSNDKIREANIMPIIKDTTNNLYGMEFTVTPGQGESNAHAIINQLVRAQDSYEGSGNLTVFLASSTVADMLLLEDTIGHRYYKNLEDLANAMTVSKVVKVPASVIPDGYWGLAVDLRDYSVGTEKNAVKTVDQFDIDFNAQKYLMETRCCGALTRPHSAIILKKASV